MPVLDALFDHFQQISSNVEIVLALLVLRLAYLAPSPLACALFTTLLKIEQTVFEERIYSGSCKSGGF
jgi:hypothetical protein